MNTKNAMDIFEITTIEQVKNYVAFQKNLWITSTVLWSDFSDDMKLGNKMIKETIEDDFLSVNDVVDLIDERNDSLREIYEHAQEIRREALLDVLKELAL